ncbi:MAG: chemotaxis protein CheW [Cyanobacteria bacterium P01_D01_bin.105]
MNENCWSDIGVWGNLSCPKLADEIHCHNCSVYSQGGRALLDRPEPEGYVTEWTALIAQPYDQIQTQSKQRLSVTIFRLAQAWLALPTSLFDQMRRPRPVHSLPHRHDPLLRGIVDVRGQLVPCVSLHNLLNITATTPDTSSPAASLTAIALSESTQRVGYPRLAVIKRSQDVWAFEVDEIYGLHWCQPTEMRAPPSLMSKALTSFTQSIFPWHQQNVSYLDPEKLLLTLRKRGL